VPCHGIAAPDTQHLSRPGPDVKFTSIRETARDAVKQLKDEGADAVVALTHLMIAQDRALAREVKEGRLGSWPIAQPRPVHRNVQIGAS